MRPQNQLLNEKEILQKVRRIAFEIWERNFEEEELVLIGIVDNGVILSELIKKELDAICPIKTQIAQLKVNKKLPTQSEPELNINLSEIENKAIVLIDDVQNTGRTLAYSLRPFLTTRVKKIETVVLVDRDHKKFPISADYVGLKLSTTLKEHIEVILEKSPNFGVYLN